METKRGPRTSTETKNVKSSVLNSIEYIMFLFTLIIYFLVNLFSIQLIYLISAAKHPNEPVKNIIIIPWKKIIAANNALF